MKRAISLNPTAEELEAWAYDDSSLAPTDFDLFLGHDLHLHDLVLKLAADARCKPRRLFLSTLYVISGDAVRTGYRHVKQKHLARLVEQAEHLGEQLTSTWASRTRRLQEHPEEFD